MAEAGLPFVYYHGVLKLTWPSKSRVEHDADDLLLLLLLPEDQHKLCVDLVHPTNSCTATKIACLRLSESCLYLFLYFRNNSSQWPTSPVNCYNSIISLKHSFSPSDQHLHLYGQHHGQGPLYPDDGSPLLPEQAGEGV